VIQGEIHVYAATMWLDLVSEDKLRKLTLPPAPDQGPRRSAVPGRQEPGGQPSGGSEGRHKGAVSLNEAKVKAEARFDGKYVLRTNTELPS
jgi:hypothetical protein